MSSYIIFIPPIMMLAYAAVTFIFRSGRGGRIGSWWREDDLYWCDMAIRDKEAELDQLRKYRDALEARR